MKNFKVTKFDKKKPKLRQKKVFMMFGNYLEPFLLIYVMYIVESK